MRKSAPLAAPKPQTLLLPSTKIAIYPQDNKRAKQDSTEASKLEQIQKAKMQSKNKSRANTKLLT